LSKVGKSGVSGGVRSLITENSCQCEGKSFDGQKL